MQTQSEPRLLAIGRQLISRLLPLSIDEYSGLGAQKVCINSKRHRRSFELSTEYGVLGRKIDDETGG